MENKRKSQIAIIAVLAVAVVALGVGFAAFSTALTITSSASVTPDDSTFRVVFADNTAQSSRSCQGRKSSDRNRIHSYEHPLITES